MLVNIVAAQNLIRPHGRTHPVNVTLLLLK